MDASSPADFPPPERDPRLLDADEATVPPRRGPGRAAVSGWIVLLLLAVIALLLFRYRTSIWMDLYDPDAVARAVTPRGKLSAVEFSQIEIFEQSAPSVVHITTVGERSRGTGTGFVWSEDGYIVTNYHVTAEADMLHVTLADNSTYAARFVGGEPAADVAVLKIAGEPGKLVPIPIGESSELKVGQNVYAIGSPFGLDQTLTTGVISGLGRQIFALDGSPIHDVIQTDAAINPGNSGGPLLDSAGRAIGINTAIFSPSGTNAGIGFAIPIDTVNRLVPDLIRNGSIPRPALGIIIYPDAALAQLRRRGVPGVPESGVLIREVLPGSAAEKAGLRGEKFESGEGFELGDVIVGLDGEAIDSANDLFSTIKNFQIGQRVTLTIIRDGQPLQLETTLQERPEGER
jgi:S1-C subfamily serine protease